MTAIYCVKCQEFTSTKSEKLVTTANGRYRLTGVCSSCGTKKGMFTNNSGKVARKTDEEREEASGIRARRYLTKHATEIGLSVLSNDEATKCVKKALPNIKWPRMPKN